MTKNKDFFTEMILEWKDILIKPNQTLSKFQDRRLAKSVLYILIAGFIAGILYKIINAIMGKKVVGVIIITPVLVILLMFIVGFFVWILGKLFRTETSLSKWLSLFFAASAPIVAFTGIPYVMYVVQIYGVYVQYLSVKYFMKLSIARSIFVSVLYLLTISVASIIFYMGFPIGYFLIGVAIFIIGILFIIKNKKISSSWQKKLVRVFGKSFESKWVYVYIRISFYVGGIIFIILGFFFWFGVLVTEGIIK